VPKKPNIQANERLDLVDFDRAASGYTDDVANIRAKNLLLDKKSRVIDGFRVQIDDQTATPGQITIYNGNALDRSGRLLNEESAPEESITTTLSGASTTFYLEVEFSDANSDSDSRMFWDPTFDNGGAPTPDGKEFPLTVPTRRTSTWRIVQPVSTTAFEVTANPNSTKVPLAKLSTDGTNKILAGASNPGLATEKGAGVLTEDIAVGASSIKVTDARYLADVGTDIVIDLGGASPETVTVSSIDRTNGTLSFAPITTAAHTIGAIIQNVLTGTLIVEKTDPSDTSGHPDVASRLFQGNERSAVALTQSKSSFNSRNDLNVRSDKQWKDMISGLIQEMKFGNMDPGITSTAAPSSFSARPRYVDPAGSITGARTATVTIGDGTNTFGDFNGTTDAPFIAAMASLPGGGQGTIYIKEGSYVFADSLSMTENTILIGESKDRVLISCNHATNPAFDINDTLNIVIKNITLQTGTGTDIVFRDVGDTLSFENTKFIGQVDISATTSLTALGCEFAPTVTGISGVVFSGLASSVLFDRCKFSAGATTSAIQGNVGGSFVSCSWETSLHAISVASSNITNFRVENSTFYTAGAAFSVSGSLNGVVYDSHFSTTGITTSDACILSLGGTGTTNVIFQGCTANSSFTGTSLSNPGAFFRLASAGSASELAINDCRFTNISVEYSQAIVNITTQVWKISASDCVVKGGTGFFFSASLGAGSTITVDALAFDGNSIALEQRVFDTGGSTAGTFRVSNSRVVPLSMSGAGDNYFFRLNSTSGDIDLTSQNCDYSPGGTSSSYFLFSGSAGRKTLSNCTATLGGTNVYFVKDAVSDRVELRDNILQSCLATNVLSLVEYTNNVGTLVVANNTFTDSLTSVASGTSSYIINSAARQSTITNNVIQGHDDNGTSTSSSIYVDLKASASCSISGNLIDFSTSGFGAGVASGIYVTIAASARQTGVLDNTIVGGSITAKNIRVATSAGSTACGEIVIEGNKVRTAANYSRGIEITLGDPNSISVVGNTISETVKVVTAAALVVSGSLGITNCCVVSSNAIYGKQSATGRTGVGMYLTGMSKVSCSNNVINRDLATTSSIGILVDNVEGATITGNSVGPSTSASISVDFGTSTKFIISSNTVSDSAATGSISPSASSGSAYLVVNNLV
jgi:hypothetical protein